MFTIIELVPFPAHAAVSGVGGETAHHCTAAFPSGACASGTYTIASATHRSSLASLPAPVAVERIGVEEGALAGTTSGSPTDGATVAAHPTIIGIVTQGVSQLVTLRPRPTTHAVGRAACLVPSFADGRVCFGICRRHSCHTNRHISIEE